jgi:hypothetical protein
LRAARVYGILFKKGVKLKKVPAADMAAELMKLINEDE